MRNTSLLALQSAEQKASELFDAIVDRGLIKSGITESELNTAIYNLAYELQGIRKFWHKRIVRAGANTLLPYAENPPDHTLLDNDILFLDFGPVYDEWEADFGKTYVLGNDLQLHKLATDAERLWDIGAAYIHQEFNTLTAADTYAYIKTLVEQSGWRYGNEHCGHLIGNFPHERLSGEEKRNYLHPENTSFLREPDLAGRERFWILEMHIIDDVLGRGAFVEKMITI